MSEIKKLVCQNQVLRLFFCCVPNVEVFPNQSFHCRLEEGVLYAVVSAINCLESCDIRV